MWFDPSTLLADVSPPANFANFAKCEGVTGGKLAELAELAAARDPATAKVGAGDTATACRGWLVTLPDGDSPDLTYSPRATRDEALVWHFGALSVEPYPPQTQPPAVLLTPSEAAAIRGWLGYIGEYDQETIAVVLDMCMTDPEAQSYFLGRSEEVPVPDPWGVRRCGDCMHFERTSHPNLGHCSKGEPEAIAGLWDTDGRHCGQYQVTQTGGK